MTAARDLMLIAVDVAPSRPLMQGDLSLALAGAELTDLLAAGTAALEGTRIVPGDEAELADSLLGQAASVLARQAPYDSAADWLWSRGDGLASVYAAGLEAQGLLERRRPRRWAPFRSGPPVPADATALHRARERLASGEPVLAGLASAAGLDGQEAPDVRDTAGDAAETVLAAVHDAVRELEALRQRRAIEQSAFDNVWRGD